MKNPQNIPEEAEIEIVPQRGLLAAMHRLQRHVVLVSG
jgi:hypothetical protein